MMSNQLLINLGPAFSEDYHILQDSQITMIDWCCFHYLVRDSLVALPEALCVQMQIRVLEFWSFCRNRIDDLETDGPALCPPKPASHRFEYQVI